MLLAAAFFVCVSLLVREVTLVRNGVDVEVSVADLTTKTPPEATLAVANVPAFVHEKLAGRLTARTVVATGIESALRADVVAAYEAAGFTPVTSPTSPRSTATPSTSVPVRSAWNRAASSPESPTA